MLHHLLRMAFVLVLTCLLTGCGAEKDRGLYKDKDRPTSGEKSGALVPVHPSRAMG